MAVHFDEDLLRLSDDYPDQRQRANHPASSVRFSSHQGATSGPFIYPASAGHHNIDHSSTVRRRSSKACDNCRKAKCKCEPGENTGEGCRNCELLGLVCTFLGPSRKRGPPKGYIDAIESRLHQLEAIVGALLLAAPLDARASTLLNDLREVDEMARGVIDRVNAGPFGPLTRRVGDGSSNELKAGRRPVTQVAKISVSMPDDSAAVDPYKWQDMLENALTHSVHAIPQPAPVGHVAVHDPAPVLPALAHRHSSSSLARSGDLIGIPPARPNTEAGSSSMVKRVPSRASLQTSLPSWVPSASNDYTANTRRRVDSNSVGPNGEYDSRPSSVSSPASAVQDHQHMPQHPIVAPQDHDGNETNSDEGSESAKDLARGIGSLSIDDSHDVRYHGKTSGLHLLMKRKAKDSTFQDSTLEERSAPHDHHSPESTNNTTEGGVPSGGARKFNARERGGLWHFPPPGLWPPVDFEGRANQSSTANAPPSDNSEQSSSTHVPSDRQTPRDTHSTSQSGSSCVNDAYIPYLEAQPVSEELMPPIHMQERLISLYFTHVHPVLPIIHRNDFLEEWRTSTSTVDASDPAGIWNKDPAFKKLKRLEVLSPLLFAMFAVAERYLDKDTTALPKGSMWTAGLPYRSHSRHALYVQKLPSRVSAVQALVLSAYFDVGVGAMASAWHASGLALRTALDIGLNRPVDEWVTPEGTRYFTKSQVETCRRVWYGVLLLENYVATYIGRPLALDENDYDTPLPSDDVMDEEIPESDHGSRLGLGKAPYVSVPGRVMATFRERARLASIHGAVMQDVYTVRPRRDRRALAASLEGKLDRWYLDLPTSLQWEYNINTQPCPPPHVILLHMEYWCSVLLLNRPFIRSRSSSSRGSSSDVDGPDRSPALRASQRAYGVCVGAANRLVSIGHVYAEHFDMNRCPVFFTYYVFTASIMHVTVYNPDDIQASCYLRQAMDVLGSMAVVWPSAGRAYELLVGAKQNIEEIEQNANASPGDIHGHHEASQQHAMPKRRADDEPEQLQYRSQLDHHRGTGAQSTVVEQQLQSNAPSVTQVHSRREEAATGKTFFGTPSYQDHFTRPEIFEGQSRGVGGPNAHPVRVTVAPPWGSTPPTVPAYSTNATNMFMDYNLSGPQSTTFMEQSSPSFPDTSQAQTVTAGPGPYPVPVTGRYGRQMSPKLHQEHFNFRAQSALSPQHSQSFWNEYSGSGNDPFADPSSLSASLYNVPLLTHIQRTPQYREQAPVGQHILNHGPPTDAYTESRQTYLPPAQSYSYDA